MEFKDRIKQAIEASGKQPSEIARLVGVSPSAVSQWLDGTTKSLRGESAVKLAQATGYIAHWIATGRGQRRANENTEPVKVRRSVPLVSWVRAGSWGDVSDPFQPGEADEWIDVYDTTPGDQAFALRVTGDSMTSPNPTDGGPNFPEGTVIVVDPSRPANAGDFVLAKDVETQQTTFKKLVSDGGRWFLKPLNRDYPTIEIDDPAMRVIGRVIESVYRRKL